MMRIMQKDKRVSRLRGGDDGSGGKRGLRCAEEALREGGVIHQSRENDGAHHGGGQAEGFIARLPRPPAPRVELPVDERQEALRDVRESPPHRLRLARAVAAERRHDTSQLGVRDVLLGEVYAERLSERDLITEHILRCARACRFNGGRDELVPALEVRIEATMRQTDRLHQRRDAHGGQAMLSE